MAEPEELANEGWINSRWRPLMAWQYFTVCLCDFVGFPIFTAVYYGNGQYHEWHPLTLQGGGLYHMAMGAIIGITAWQRTEEKIAIYKANVTGATAEQTTLSTSRTD